MNFLKTVPILSIDFGAMTDYLMTVSNGVQIIMNWIVVDHYITANLHMHGEQRTQNSFFVGLLVRVAQGNFFVE